MVWLDSDASVSMEEKIEWCVVNGLTFKQIKLACGNPTTREIKDVIKRVDPKMYGMLGDTESLERYRDILYGKSCLTTDLTD